MHVSKGAQRLAALASPLLKSRPCFCAWRSQMVLLASSQTVLNFVAAALTSDSHDALVILAGRWHNDDASIVASEVVIVTWLQQKQLRYYVPEMMLCHLGQRRGSFWDLCPGVDEVWKYFGGHVGSRAVLLVDNPYAL